MVRLYSTEPVSKVAATTDAVEEKKNLVISLLRHIHLCAAAEAISFARYLNVDLAQYYELVDAAAGGSAMFRNRGPEMMGLVGGQGLPDGVNGGSSSSKTVAEAAKELSVVLQKARDINCPLHLGSAALSILLSAKRKGLGESSDANVIKMWEGC
jgi:3-hydroxyisobutyrate dehydrogenase